jgi:hypothetical protein
MALAEAQAEALARQKIITRMVEGAKVKTSAGVETEVMVCLYDIVCLL